MRGKENLLAIIGIVILFLIIVLMFMKPNYFSYSPQDSTQKTIEETITTVTTTANVTDFTKDQNRISIEN